MFINANIKSINEMNSLDLKCDPKNLYSTLWNEKNNTFAFGNILSMPVLTILT